MSTYDADANSVGFRSSEELLLWQQAQEKKQLVERNSQSVSDNAACGAQTIHNDHPLRHFDNTCPACVADDALPEPVAWLYEWGEGKRQASTSRPAEMLEWLDYAHITPLVRGDDAVILISSLREQLAHERREHQAAVHSCHDDCKMAGCVNVRLRQQLAEAERDADRYRWLRDHDLSELYCSWVDDGLNTQGTEPEQFDAAIDAAIAAGAQK